MSVAQTEITLYIHPDAGPIMPMKLNMLAIEIAIVSSSVHGNRDDARAREIAARIIASFPKVQAESRLQDIRILVSRLSHIATFDGVVLHLPGMIDGTPQPKNPRAEEFEKLDTEAREIRNQFEVVSKDYGALLNTVDTLQNDNDRITASLRTLAEDNDLSRTALINADIALDIAKQEAITFQEQVNGLEQEKAALQVDLDKAKQERRMYQKIQQEVVDLQQKLDGAQIANNELRKALIDREQEISDLRRTNEKLLKQLGKQNTPPGLEDDEAKESWFNY